MKSGQSKMKFGFSSVKSDISKVKLGKAKDLQGFLQIVAFLTPRAAPSPTLLTMTAWCLSGFGLWLCSSAGLRLGASLSPFSTLGLPLVVSAARVQPRN